MSDELKISKMRVDWRAEALGLDSPNPRLSWIVESDQRGQKQTAYRVLAASRSELLEDEKADLWDSGKVVSSDSVQVVYQGKPLGSRQRVWWRVTAWDQGDQPSTSQPAWWEMGLLKPMDWVGSWIGSSLVGGKFTSAPCPYLRKEAVAPQKVASARLYITALGLYEAWINGQRVSEDVFTPGWSDYHNRAAYQVYDVTGLMRDGTNVLGMVLGDGWYCGHVAAMGRQNYGDQPKLIAQLELVLEDGSRQTVVSDGSWKWSSGPILESDMLMGESYDARRELTGWAVPEFDDSAWQPVVVMADPGLAKVAQVGATVRRIETLQPVKVPAESYGWVSSRWIFDLGQNITGRVRLTIRGKAGETVTLRYAEILKPDGSLYTENLRSARATDYYTLRGDGEETYEPTFTFHGFRYVELSNFPGRADQFSITGVVLHSDMAPSGRFACSDPLINQLQHNIAWGQKGNFLDVPTDCPQRDERLGWTGDAQVFIRTASFNFDVAGFFNRWQQSLADSQNKDGSVPAVIPGASLVPGDGGPAWSDAMVICPWTVYRVYGDRRILETYYECFTRYIGYLKANSVGLIRSHPDWKGFPGFGDWLSIKAETPIDLIGTAFFAYSTRLVSQIARVLGKEADSAMFEALYQEIRQAFIKRFVTPGGLVVGHTQTAYVLALYFDLLPEDARPKVADALARDIRRRGGHLSTGFVGAPYLLHTLTQAGQTPLAYQLLSQKTWPSWLYPVTKGATTIWERWDGWTEDKGFQDPGMNSFNHYAYGSVGSWLYQTVAGIDLDDQATGYERLVIHPRPGGGLKFASADYDSVRGRVSSRWTIETDGFHLSIRVPAGSQAMVYIQADSQAEVSEEGGFVGATFLRLEDGCVVYQVESGVYAFTSLKNIFEELPPALSGRPF